MTKSPLEKSNFKIKVTKARRTKRQSEIKKTHEEIERRKKELEESDVYIQKRIADFKSSWSKFYFGKTPESYVALVDYKDNLGRTHPFLKGKPIHRIQREFLVEIKECLRQIEQVSNHLTKKHKQDLIDSFELTQMITSLLQIGEFSSHEKINTHNFTSNMFYITLKILIDSAPLPIRSHLIKSMGQFFDMNNLVIELGQKKAKFLPKPRIINDNRGGIRLEIDHILNERL